MFRKFFSVGSAISVLALATMTSPGCALLGLEEEEETTTVATGSLSELEGTWNSSCILASDGSTYDKHTLSLSGTNLTSTTTSYQDSSCSTSRFSTEYAYTNVAAGTAINLSNGNPGWGISGTVQSLNVTPLSSDMTNTMNSISFCGLSTWQLNTASNAQGLDCGSGAYPTQGSAWNSRYRVSGTTLTVQVSDTATRDYIKQ